MFTHQQQQALNRGLLLPIRPKPAQLRPSRPKQPSLLPVPCLVARLHAIGPQLQRVAAFWGQRAAYDSDDYEWEALALGGTAAAAASIAVGVAAGEGQLSCSVGLCNVAS
jgi:hypothetical protein